MKSDYFILKIGQPNQTNNVVLVTIIMVNNVGLTSHILYEIMKCNVCDNTTILYHNPLLNIHIYVFELSLEGRRFNLIIYMPKYFEFISIMARPFPRLYLIEVYKLYITNVVM